MKPQTGSDLKAFFTSLVVLTLAGPAAALEVTASKDVELRSTSTTCPSGLADSTSMRIGFDDATVDVTHRAALHFDLDTAGVPANVEGMGARLVFYASAQTGADFDIDVHRLTEPAWAENATWTTADCGIPVLRAES